MEGTVSLCRDLDRWWCLAVVLVFADRQAEHSFHWHPGEGVEALRHSLVGEIKLKAMPQVSSFGVGCRCIE